MNPRPFPGLGLVLVAALAPARATAQQRSVSLAEAIALAQQHDPNVVQAQGDVPSAGAETRGRYGSFLPTVSAGAGGGRSRSAFQRIDPRTGQLVGANNTTTSVNLQLSAGVDLFTGFRRGAELSAARAEGDRAQAALDARKWQTAFNTSREFFSALQNGELIRVRRDGIRRAEEQLAIAVARLRTRGATVSDSLQGVVEVSQARLRLLTEESQLAQAEANLARAIGVSGRVSALDDSSIAIRTIAIDTAAVMAEARERSPAVIQAEASVRAAKANLSAAKAVYWPQVQLNGSTNYGGNDQDPLNKYQLFNNRNLGLNVSIPLFNGFQREQQIVNRSVALDVARARATDAAHDVEAQLIGALASLRTAQERVDVARSNLDAARANARVQLERYRLGTIEIERLVQAQDRLSQAEEGAVTARFDYLRSKAQIEALIGRTL